MSIFHTTLRNWLWGAEKARAPRLTRLGLEWLEARLAPAALSTSWTGNVSNNWGTAGN